MIEARRVKAEIEAGRDGDVAVPATIEDLARWAFRFVAVAALGELILLRVGTRTLRNIPAVDRFSSEVGILHFVGSTAYRLASTGLIVALVLGILVMFKRGGPRAALIAGSGVAFLAAAGCELAGVDQLPTTAIMIAAVGICTVLAILRDPTALAWPLACFGGGFTTLSVDNLVQRLAQHGVDVDLSDGVILAGEGLAVLFLLLTPRLTLRSREVPDVDGAATVDAGRRVRPAENGGNRVALLSGAVAGLAGFGGLVANESVTKVLMLWNFGIAGYFPAVLYGAGFGAAVYAAVVLWRTGSRDRLAALVMLIGGGVVLQNTYQTGLVLAGMIAFEVAALSTAQATELAPSHSGASRHVISPSPASIRKGPDATPANA